MKQPKALRRVGPAFQSDIELESLSCVLSHSAVSSGQEETNPFPKPLEGCRPAWAPG